MHLDALYFALPAFAALGALLICYVLFGWLRHVATRYPGQTLPAAFRHLRGPVLLAAPVAAAAVALPFAHMPALRDGLLHAAELLLIAAVAWAGIRGFDIWRDLLARRYRLDVADNLHARRVHTQVMMLRRIFAGLVMFVAAAAMLMTFPQVRAIGATLFASAGVAGLVLGLAARPAIGNLLAGLQIALSDPIRLDDVVIVAGECGRIEEIRTTYVVVRIWDERRLMVPLAYFIEQPFQNWTRRTAELLGTVYLHADYTVPVEALRAELQRILEGTSLWDRRVCALQVTDATASTVELRALVSAADSGKLWDLRCLARERLLDFLRSHYPLSLPHSRVHLQDQAVRHDPTPRADSAPLNPSP